MCYVFWTHDWVIFFSPRFDSIPTGSADNENHRSCSEELFREPAFQASSSDCKPRHECISEQANTIQICIQ